MKNKPGVRKIEFKSAIYNGIKLPIGFEALILFLFQDYKNEMKYFFQALFREPNIISIEGRKSLVNRMYHILTPDEAKVIKYYFGFQKYKMYDFQQLEDVMEMRQNEIKKIFFGAINKIKASEDLMEDLKSLQEKYKIRANKRARRVDEIRKDPDFKLMLSMSISELGLPTEMEEKFKNSSILRIIELVSAKEVFIFDILEKNDKYKKILEEKLYSNFLELEMDKSYY